MDDDYDPAFWWKALNNEAFERGVDCRSDHPEWLRKHNEHIPEHAEKE